MEKRIVRSNSLHDYKEIENDYEEVNNENPLENEEDFD